VVEYGKGALKQALASVQKFAQVEGLDAHGRSATIRADK
jgi:histidinol dehydrogenase